MSQQLYEWLNEGSKDEFLSRKKVTKLIVEKWNKTGLLEGTADKTYNQVKSNIAVLLENQLRYNKKMQLINETSAMASADVQGTSTAVFPMIRRIFAEIVANELVSVQPLSQPTGLIFFLDFQAGTSKGVGHAFNASVYGGGVVGSQITGGLDLSSTNLESGPYSLNFGYSSPTGSATASLTALISGTVGAGNNELDRAVEFDVDLSGSAVVVFSAPLSSFTQINQKGFITLTDQTTTGDYVATQVRRLTSFSGSSTTLLKLVYVVTGTLGTQVTGMTGSPRTFKWAIVDDFQNVGSHALGAVVGDPAWGFEFGNNTGENAAIPEIDIKIDSISITTLTKKLKARWTPELAQDLDAYQNLDAEVELTSVISELIGLEIDAEILGDLFQNARDKGAATRYWSRRPGQFLNVLTGDLLAAADQGDFTGNVSEWYMTLIERMNDVSGQIHRYVLRGGANWVVTSPDVVGILESTNLWRADMSNDDNKGSAGVMKSGSISTKKWDVYSTPYFFRNVILLGRKGKEALETGYIYAPYVPLQTTQAIPDPDTFVLNKGVMTRYGKKLINPRNYGLVFVKNLMS